ncbi:MAG: FeoB-associated Cys-rich membrane protein [Armatimonadota bacterium]
MEQTIIVGIIVVATVAWAVWRIVRRTDTGGCASCGSAGSCPFAAEGECPSELSDRAEERVSPEPAADRATDDGPGADNT